MRIPSAIQLFQSSIAATVAEEHGAFAAWRPPHDHVSGAYDYALRQNLQGCCSTKASHQVNEHLPGNELTLGQTGFLVLVSHLMQRDKRVPIRKAVVTTGPVHQQDSAQPEVLT